MNLVVYGPSRLQVPVKTHVVSPLPHTYMKPGSLPTSFDPRNMNGVDLTTWNKNQHIPQCKHPLYTCKSPSFSHYILVRAPHSITIYM